MNDFLGLDIPKEKGFFFSDLVFFIIIVGVPGSIFGLANDNFFYIRGIFDLILLSWLLTLPYLFLYHFNLIHINRFKWGHYLIILNILLILFFFFSLVRYIPFSEAGKVYRYFFMPISALAILLRCYSMEIYRIRRFFNWILIVMAVQGVFYIIFHLTGFNIFAQDIFLKLYYRGNIVCRYYKAYPILNHILIYISAVNLVRGGKYFKKYLPLFLISLTCLFLTSTRSNLITNAVFIFLICLFLSILQRRVVVNKILLMGFFLLVFLGTYKNIFPANYQYVTERFLELKQAESIEDVGNFNLRIKLIKDAIESYDGLVETLFGKGYERYAYSGEYDLAIGGDTFIAPVLYCEGIIGLIVRFIPILILLFSNMKIIFNPDQKSDIPRYIPVIIVCAILSQLVNIVQTPIFKVYTSIMVFLFMLDILKYKYEKHSEPSKLLPD